MSSNKMDRLTQRARLVLYQAEQEAKARNSPLIHLEHVFVALALVDGSISQRVFAELGVSADDLRSAYAPSLPPTRVQIELSPQVKKMLEYSVDEARRIGHAYLGTEHLLLAALRLQPATVLAALKRRLITPDKVLDMLVVVMRQSAQDP